MNGLVRIKQRQS